MIIFLECLYFVVLPAGFTRCFANGVCLHPQELVCLCGAEERELRGAGEHRELPGACDGPLPGLPARLPATSDVSNHGSTEGEVVEGLLDEPGTFGC